MCTTFPTKTVLFTAAACSIGIGMLSSLGATKPPEPSLDGAFPVLMRVDAANTKGELRPLWRFFGADEPNYAYMKDGKKLLAELGALAPGKVYFRAHNLLTSGDGTPALKWGSTNAYTEDERGKPVYDWTILDRIFDAYLERGVKPYVQLGFMPKALSTRPDPYQQAILRAILRGTRAPEKFAKYRDKGCKASEAEIAQALTGSYREEHLFELKLAYEAWQFTLGQVAKVDGQIALQLGRMKCDRALPPLKPKARPKRRVNSPGFDVRAALYYVVGLDLTEIEGISELTALTVISELGPGVSQFATVKKFCSWLGLCPNWQKTGGRVKSSRTRRGVNRAAQALRLAAQSLHHSQGALGGFLRRMKGRLGAQAAVTATAHKLARIVYLALKHGLTYVRQSQEEYEAQMKEKQIKALRRKARQLGLEVVEKASGGVPTAAAASAQG